MSHRRTRDEVVGPTESRLAGRLLAMVAAKHAGESAPKRIGVSRSQGDQVATLAGRQPRLGMRMPGTRLKRQEERVRLAEKLKLSPRSVVQHPK